MQSLLRRSVALVRVPIASTSSRSLATHVVAATPFEGTPSQPDSSLSVPTFAHRKSKNPYLVQAPVERPKVPRHSANSSRITGRREQVGPRKALSFVLQTDEGVVPHATSGEVKIFLPSVFVRLVRNQGAHAGDPYTATFRTDLRLTKPDISNYLRNVYGLAITSLRTINYSSPLSRNPIGGGYGRGGGTKSYKKVLVTLTEPFWYPPERSREWCNEHFQREQMEEMRDRKMLKIGDGQKYGVASHRYRGAGKLRAEVERLKAIVVAGGTVGEVESDGTSALRRPSGRKQFKNVVRSRAEKISEAKTVVELEMDRLRSAGWVRLPSPLVL